METSKNRYIFASIKSDILCQLFRKLSINFHKQGIMARNSQFMSLPKSMVDALQKEEMLLVAGGSVGQEASTTNNADGTCSGTNNDSGKCSGTNNGSGKCNVSIEDHISH